MKTVTIDITPDGSTTVETAGYKGASCKEATSAIEKALGKTVTDTKKPEYLQTAKAKASQNARQ